MGTIRQHITMSIQHLPIDCQDIILEQLGPDEIRKIQDLLPAWRNACNSLSLWRKKVTEQRSSAIEMNSDIVNLEFISDRDHCFILTEVNRSYHESMANWKKSTFKKPEEIENVIVKRMKKLLPRIEFNSPFSQYQQYRSGRKPHVILRGPGLETGCPDKFLVDFMHRGFNHDTEAALTMVGADSHGGIVMKYNQGSYQNKFILKTIYSGTRAQRTNPDNQ